MLARITELEGRDVEGYRFEAEPIRRLPRDSRRLVGIFRAAKPGGGTIEPVDRKSLRSWSIQKSDQGEAKDGDLVRFELARRGRFTTPQARIVETIGNPEDQRQISLIAVHAHGIPDDFPESVINETAGLTPPTMKGREDFRTCEDYPRHAGRQEIDNTRPFNSAACMSRKVNVVLKMG